jgi:hypothetical protein
MTVLLLINLRLVIREHLVILIALLYMFDVFTILYYDHHQSSRVILWPLTRLHAPPIRASTILTAIAAAPGLTKVQRQDMASAVRTAARILGRPPEQIPADPPLLARRLAEVPPSPVGSPRAAGPTCDR